MFSRRRCTSTATIHQRDLGFVIGQVTSDVSGVMRDWCKDRTVHSGWTLEQAQIVGAMVQTAIDNSLAKRCDVIAPYRPPGDPIKYLTRSQANALFYMALVIFGWFVYFGTILAFTH